MSLNWLLPSLHTTKSINCKYVNTFFNLSVDIKEFCLNIKGLEIVGQIVIYNYQSNKCMKEMLLLNIFCESLIKYFAWKNYLGQSTGGNCLGRGGITWRVIIQGTIIQVPIVRGQFFWVPFSGGNYPEAIVLELYIFHGC